MTRRPGGRSAWRDRQVTVRQPLDIHGDVDLGDIELRLAGTTAADGLRPKGRRHDAPPF